MFFLLPLLSLYILGLFPNNHEKIGVMVGIDYYESTTRENFDVFSFLKYLGKKPVFINYLELRKCKDDPDVEKCVYHSIEYVLKKKKITKVIIGGDHYNYNAPPFHPNPYRKLATKALNALEKNGSIKILGICGGMQGILYYNDIKIEKISEIVGEKKAKKYMNAYDLSCKTVLNKIFVARGSQLEKVINEYELKYEFKFDRNEKGEIVVHIASAHSNGFSAFDKTSLKKIESTGYKISGTSEDGVIYIVENDKSLLIQGHPEFISFDLKYINCFDKRDILFNRMIFENFLKNN